MKLYGRTIEGDNERIKTEDVIHKYASDYKIIFVGDATMAPYEITNPGEY